MSWCVALAFVSARAARFWRLVPKHFSVAARGYPYNTGYADVGLLPFGLQGGSIWVKTKKQAFAGLAAVALLALGYAPAQGADVYKGTLEGVVKDAAGTPVAGAFVKL